MAWQTFYSYAHRDEEARDRLAVYLAPLRHNGRIVEWHDRKIEPGTDWNASISSRLDSANLVLMLLSPDFLASDYCFGVEVERCMTRLKKGNLKVVPILTRPCLWEDSPFSALQIIPKDARPISTCSSPEEAWKEVALSISKLVAGVPPAPQVRADGAKARNIAAVGELDELVREQVRAYARLYERTRQRMTAGDARTRRMEMVFQGMKSIALAAYPLLSELAESPFPGERLAAVAILEVVGSEAHLPFLVNMLASEKPFAGFHAAQALRFAVSALEPGCYTSLAESLSAAQESLRSAHIGFDTDRSRVLDAAQAELRENIAVLSM